MGKDETNEGGDIKSSKSVKYGKSFRKAVLGSNTLALCMTPSSVTNQISVVSRGQLANSLESCSPFILFNMLKEVNRYMVKGTTLYESLKELRLCGWVSPYTLLLTGPAEDMKVVKHAWIKRYLKNPLGYFIKDVGIIQEFVVELLPQSPFLSLKTALFDAVADLNNQSIFPSKENLREYLRKHYPEVKLPEIKDVHECLGRLIKERRLYHNGRGYFIICNENVLNELKLLNEIPDSRSLYHSSAESTQIKGFTLSSSVTNSSSPGVTDLEVNSCSLNTSNSAEVSTIELGFPSFLESNRNGNNPVKNFFKKHGKNVKKQDPNEVTAKTQSFDKCIGVLDINAIQSIERKGGNCNNSPAFIKREHLNESPSYIKREKGENPHVNKCENLNNPYVSKQETKEKSHGDDTKDDVKVLDCNHGNYVKSHLNKRDNEVKLNVECISEKVTNNNSHNTSMPKRKSKLKRSQSLDGKIGKIRREVTFAIVGLPYNPTYQKCYKTKELGYFKRSHSFGVGSSKSFYKRSRDDTNVKTDNDDQDAVVRTEMKSYNSNVDSREIPPVFLHGTTIDNETINRDNSLSFNYSDREDHLHGAADLDHPPELLHNYENLGSSISFHKNNQTEYTVMDLSSPPISTSLAEELKEVCNVKNKLGTEVDQYNGSLCKSGLGISLLSLRSCKKFDRDPYGTQYVFDILDGSTYKENTVTEVSVGQFVEDGSEENGYLTTKEEGNDDKKHGTKSRFHSRNSVQRKQNQKDRNSLIFDEKRSSLKVMGMV